MWSSWYQSDPGPNTVGNRAQTERSTDSRKFRGTVRSVSEIDRPLASVKARTSSALARPCSESWAPTTRLRPRHSNESKLSRSLIAAAEVLRQRRDVVPDPVGDCGRHLATHDGRRLHRDLPLVRQHDRLQPHQVLAAAATGAMDIGNTRSDGYLLRQRLPAGRRLRRGRRGLLGGLACLDRLGPRSRPQAGRAPRPGAAWATAPLRDEWPAQPGRALAE